MRKDGIELPPAPDAAPPAAVDAAGTDGAETVPPNDVPAAPAEQPLPPPRFATAFEIFTWVKKVLLSKKRLAENQAELAAFWIISNRFQEALSVRPCLVITGPAHDAGQVLQVLNKLCQRAALLAGVRRSDLDALQRFSTLLVFEPNLDRRTAELVSSLTDTNIVTVNRSECARYSKSIAIYAGENPETHKIQNSIHIHIPPASAEPSASPPWLQKMIERIPVHLDQYRDKNLSHIRHWTWVPYGLSSETAAIAAPLGSCFVGAPELRQKLVALLKTQDMQRQSELSNSTDAIVLEATRTLCRDEREHAYAREIAAAANRLYEARGETARLRPEHIGHVLKRFGLRTRRLSQTGNGLTFDKATVAQIEQLCADYGMEDTPAEAENLHGSQTTEKEVG
jgi:hypothetical protein